MSPNIDDQMSKLRKDDLIKALEGNMNNNIEDQIRENDRKIKEEMAKNEAEIAAILNGTETTEEEYTEPAIEELADVKPLSTSELDAIFAAQKRERELAAILGDAEEPAEEELAEEVEEETVEEPTEEDLEEEPVAEETTEETPEEDELAAILGDAEEPTEEELAELAEETIEEPEDDELAAILGDAEEPTEEELAELAEETPTEEPVREPEGGTPETPETTEERTNKHILRNTLIGAGLLAVGILIGSMISCSKKKGAGTGDEPTPTICTEYIYDEGEKYENPTNGIDANKVTKGENGKYYVDSDSAEQSKKITPTTIVTDELGGHYENGVYIIFGTKYESRELFEEIRDSKYAVEVELKNGVICKYVEENTKTR